MSRIMEESSPVGKLGWPYDIFARPAGLAVYAIAGLENRDTGELMPYVMGVATNVLTSPGAETTGVDIHMTETLDRQMQVELSSLPQPAAGGPDQFRVRAHIDLGGQGVIVREIGSKAFDLLTSFTSGAPFQFFAQPALTGDLMDARYLVVAGWYTGQQDDTSPYTEVRRVGVMQTDQPLAIDDLLAIPSAVAPPPGAWLPDDRVLHWSQAGAAPDMYVIEITGGDNAPAWTQIAPGTVTQSTVPDFTSVTSFDDIAPGVITWSVRAVRIADFDYDQFKYNMLSRRYWTHTSIDTFTMQR
jgi:hypothetical protein